jgi:NAD(P)H dehydrogenase (quinone)
MKYAVTAATGNFGQAAVKTLSELTDKSNIVVVARNQEKANKLFPGFEVREGNYDSVDSMTKALEGIDRVLFISSQPGGKVSRGEQHKNVVQALQNAKVDFVAYTSFPDAQNSASALAADHKMTEQLIEKTGIKHSFLRNNWYLEDEIAFLQMGANGDSASYWADGKAGWALEREFAEAAAKVLVSDNSKDIYEFAGPMKTYEDLGQTLKAATGKDLAIKQISKDDYTKLLAAGGLDDATAAMFASFQDPIQEGSLNHARSDLTDVLGHAPLDLQDAIKEILSR